jgi:hypothetical protein
MSFVGFVSVGRVTGTFAVAKAALILPCAAYGWPKMRTFAPSL